MFGFLVQLANTGSRWGVVATVEGLKIEKWKFRMLTQVRLNFPNKFCTHFAMQLLTNETCVRICLHQCFKIVCHIDVKMETASSIPRQNWVGISDVSWKQAQKATIIRLVLCLTGRTAVVHHDGPNWSTSICPYWEDRP